MNMASSPSQMAQDQPEDWYEEIPLPFDLAAKAVVPGGRSLDHISRAGDAAMQREAERFAGYLAESVVSLDAARRAQDRDSLLAHARTVRDIALPCDKPLLSEVGRVLVLYIDSRPPGDAQLWLVAKSFLDVVKGLMADRSDEWTERGHRLLRDIGDVLKRGV